MPRNRNSSKPPAAMTWSKAMPILAIAGVFDALRLLFEMFWFFGPAIAALYCTSVASDYMGTAASALICGAAATAGGVFGLAVLAPFGVIMAMAVGLFGWMTIGLMTLMTNPRLLKENAGNTLWFVGSLFVSEMPLLGAVPALTGTMVKMYRTQIKKESAALKEYEKQHAEEQRRDRQERIATLTQARNVQMTPDHEEENYARFEEETADDAQYDEVSGDTHKSAYEINSAATNDDSYIPQDMDREA